MYDLHTLMEGSYFKCRCCVFPTSVLDLKPQCSPRIGAVQDHTEPCKTLIEPVQTSGPKVLMPRNASRCCISTLASSKQRRPICVLLVRRCRVSIGVYLEVEGINFREPSKHTVWDPSNYKVGPRGFNISCILQIMGNWRFEAPEPPKNASNSPDQGAY